MHNSISYTPIKIASARALAEIVLANTLFTSTRTLPGVVLASGLKQTHLNHILISVNDVIFFLFFFAVLIKGKRGGGGEFPHVLLLSAQEVCNLLVTHFILRIVSKVILCMLKT